ncbi:FkbM family methyltransferase [bacterium]|nr:FkbM family methyltransferase [bacterium]
MSEFKYYAEYNTDMIIREKYFPNFNYKGIMVEVGGATPEFLSMSKHFKDYGWRTIIIEPNPMFAKKHKSVGNEVYEYACSFEDKDNIDFFVVSQEVNVNAYGGVLTDHSFSSLGLKENYLTKTNFISTSSNSKLIKVNVRRLDTILSELKINKIDLLSIDTEGWEIEVMKGFDPNRIECSVIVLENFTHEDSYTKHMESIGYFIDKIVDYNYIFTKSK